MVDGLVTLPPGLPKLTLGWGVLRHAATTLRQPNGPKAGQQWSPIDSQALFMLWWYALDDNGRWLFDHGVRRLAKGSGKSPFAAVWAIEELVGPVRLKDFDSAAPGGCVGMPVSMPLVQIAATAESQTANTMRMVRAMTAKGSRVTREYHLDPGKTMISTPEGGLLEVITSSASAAEGAEVTAAVEDETEHWTPATGGPTLAETLDRNLGKSSSRAIETANAWEPGAGSVAEATWDAFQAQRESDLAVARGERDPSKLRPGARILYDARVASPATDLEDEASLMRGLEFVYEGCSWIDLRTIRDRIWSPRTKPSVSRRFYLNQPVASEDAWTTPMAWAALSSIVDGVDTRPVDDEEEVVLFFDGSKSRDATALIGCCMSDGHIFTVGVWEPDPMHDTADVVDAAAVDSAVERAFQTWTVLAFFADVKEWEGFAKVTWPERYASQLVVHAVPAGKDPQPIAWDMRSRAYEFGVAAELTEAEISDRAFTHDGDERVARHVGNARNRPARGVVSIGKESPDSARKIDAAVCVIGARMVRRLAMAAAPKKVRTGEAFFR